MSDVVLEHVVLRLQRGELGHKTGVARWIEDDIPYAEKSEARCRGQQQEAARYQVLLAPIHGDLHDFSFGLEWLNALRTGWVQPVRGEIAESRHDPARKFCHRLANVDDLFE